MNFLQLAQQVRSKCGISGSGPATVAAQPGEMGRVVDWTNEAWLDIQNKHDSWNWMRAEFSLQTLAGTGAYPALAAGVTDLAYWHDDTMRCFLTAGGYSTEQYVSMMGYDDFRNMYLMGAMRDQASLPTIFSVRPRDKALLLGPKPDAVYTFAGEYQKAARPMVDALDLPGAGLFPAEFHMLIVWLAVQKYSVYEGTGALYQMAEREAKRIWSRLERDQLPQIELGAPLA